MDVSSQKKNILLILHIPPPIHGAALVGKNILDSRLINENFNVDHINLSTSDSMNEIGKGKFKKIINLFKIQFQVLKALTSKRYDLCYVTITLKKPGFYKDLVIVSILK